MPRTPCSIIVIPQVPVTVDITTAGGVSVTSYTTENGSSTHTLPLAITSQTRFWLTVPGVYTISALYNGVEIADQDNATRSVEVGPDGTVTVGVSIDRPSEDTTEATSITATVAALSETYSSASSHQTVAADLELAAGAGRDVAAGTSFLAPIMGNLLGGALTKTGNYIAGIIAHFSATSTASTYPTGGVLAGIGDGVNDTGVHGVVAYIDGDSETTIGGAAFKVMSNNSTAASGFHFGVDLQSAAHDGYQAVDKDFYLSAPVRLVEDVCELIGSGAPTDGTSGTGVAVAGPGSRYTDIAAGKLYINTNTKASPTWTVVGSQS